MYVCMCAVFVCACVRVSVCRHVNRVRWIVQEPVCAFTLEKHGLMDGGSSRCQERASKEDNNEDEKHCLCLDLALKDLKIALECAQHLKLVFTSFFSSPCPHFSQALFTFHTAKIKYNQRSHI